MRIKLYTLWYKSTLTGKHYVIAFKHKTHVRDFLNVPWRVLIKEFINEVEDGLHEAPSNDPSCGSI